jgi:GAF domain-containing protein
VATVPGSRWASLTVTGAGGSPATTAATDQLAAAVDRLQYELGEGPCLHASSTGSAVTVEDLHREARWPQLASAAMTGTPVRAVLSAPVPVPATSGGASLNFYGDTPGAYTAASLQLAALAGATTALALAALNERQRSRGLEEALVSNRLIGAAVGVLMTRHRTTYDQAFSALRRVSMDANRKLRDLADEVLLTGTVSDVERRNQPQTVPHD